MTLPSICLIVFLLFAPVAHAQGNDDNPQWDYGRIPDKMSDHDAVYASLESSDGMYLTVEHNRYGLTAYIYFLEGNDRLFFCVARPCTVDMRFEKGAIEHWSVVGSNNGNDKVLHFRQPEALITRLKTTHHLVIDPPMFQHSMTFEFFTDGFAWPPPARDAKGLPINSDAIAKSTASPPVCFYSPNPPLTKEGVAAQFAGTVGVESTVSKDGTVQDVKVLQSPGYGLDEQITRILKTWRCKPALNASGEPISATMPIRFKFDWLSGGSTSN